MVECHVRDAAAADAGGGGGGEDLPQLRLRLLVRAQNDSRAIEGGEERGRGCRREEQLVKYLESRDRKFEGHLEDSWKGILWKR